MESLLEESKQTKLRKVGFAHDNFMLLHENYDYYHSERPSRIMSIYQHLENCGLIDRCVKVDCPHAEIDQLLRVHTKEHIAKVDATKYSEYVKQNGEKEVKPTQGKHVQYLTSDTYCNKHTADCALMAAGASVECCDKMFMYYQCDSVFAAIRPPGHHADEGNIQGFCFFNNAAVAAQHLIDEYGLKKVLIFDWDVHFGDGTSKIFYKSDQVLYVSIHRYDQGQFYPGEVGSPKYIGEGKGEGYNINFGYDWTRSESKVGDMEFIYACQSILFPIIKEFGPEAIIISCGFDSAEGDQVGQAGVSPAGFAWMTYGLMKNCEKVIALLEGGYNLKSLAVSSESVLETLFVNKEEEFNKLLSKLAGSDITYDIMADQSQKLANSNVREVSNTLKELLKNNWKCLKSD
ncbi:hypothetical protein FGO68_gene13176 [Halteria grandinella]|uniref:histone deacetylase n=1 Tax=Halteria grandinella TaxID=5974 RepID=A0A8J8NQ55_HALGN|nr:hypothetical protein FGO68_gene13176 [Halteria grandinella]